MDARARVSRRAGWSLIGAGVLALLLIPSTSFSVESVGRNTYQTQRSTLQKGQNKRPSNANSRNRSSSKPRPARPEVQPAEQSTETTGGNVQESLEGPAAPAEVTLRSASADEEMEKAGPPPIREDDPVYKAWESFLKEQSRQEGENSAVEQAPPAGTHDAMSSPLSRKTSVGSPWGTVAAAVFGGAGLLGAWAVRRHASRLSSWLAGRQSQGGEGHRVQVLSVNPVSAHGSVAVVAIHDEVLVLGVTAQQVSLLLRMTRSGNALPLEQQAVPNSSRMAQETGSARAVSPDNFGDLLGGLMQPRRTDSQEAAAPRVNPSPLAQYASHAAAQASVQTAAQPVSARSPAFSAQSAPLPRASSAGMPAADDMAEQVLRKMKSMRRFRVGQ